MDKITPYLRPLVIVVFGLIIWYRKLDTFVDAWVIGCLCLAYGLLRAFFVWKKSRAN